MNALSEKVIKQIRSLFNIQKDCGYSEQELIPLAACFGKIPALLHDYYRHLGKNQALNHTQDSLVRPEHINHPVYQNDDFCIFYVENQDVCRWAIKKSDLPQDNPPVYVSVSFAQNDWQEECATLSDFLLAMAHLQGGFALPYASEDFRFLTLDELALVQKQFKKKPFSLNVWCGGIDFYGNDDVDSIVVLSASLGTPQLFYASSLQNHFEQLNEFLCDIGTV